MATGESIRAAFASFAADSPDNLFPAAGSITGYGNLTMISNRNGGTLKATAAAMGISFVGYSVSDSDGDNTNDTYTLTLSVSGVPAATDGSLIQLTPQGIVRCPAGVCP